MRQKMITLCPTTYEWAQKEVNFSQWVRSKILERVNKSESEPQKEVRREKCEHGWALNACQQWGPCSDR